MFYASPVVMTAEGDGYQRYSTPYAAGIMMATIYGPPRMGPRIPTVRRWIPRTLHGAHLLYSMLEPD